MAGLWAFKHSRWRRWNARPVLFGPSCQPKHQTESSNRSTSTNVACSLHLPRSEFELWFVRNKATDGWRFECSIQALDPGLSSTKENDRWVETEHARFNALGLWRLERPGRALFQGGDDSGWWFRWRRRPEQLRWSDGGARAACSRDADEARETQRRKNAKRDYKSRVS